jgi:two-component system sensor histidine kinase KdpD
MDRTSPIQLRPVGQLLPSVLNQIRRLWIAARAYAIASAIIAATTLIGFVWIGIPDPRNLSLLFLAAVLGIGAWLGMKPALWSAVLAFFTYNFFLVEPRLSLTFTPADMLALSMFLVAALLVGGLAGRLSDRARAATNRLRDLTLLFEASRDLSIALTPDDAAHRLMMHFERAGAAAAIWLVSADGHLHLVANRRGKDAAAGSLAASPETLLASEQIDEAEERLVLRLEVGDRELGAVALWPLTGEPSFGPDRRSLQALLELGAVAIDRARLAGEVAEATVVAEKEGLRTALLSSLSHDLRTPISTILASATGLLDHGSRFDQGTQRELIETIQDETERLNRYVSNLLEMTKLESGALQLRSALIDPVEAVVSALRHVEHRLKGREVRRRFDGGGQRILVDPVLIEQALVNVLENAIAHTPPTASIQVSTFSRDDHVVIAVEDNGPGIPPDDLQRIFDKFFRGRSDRGQGVGLGLSVSRGLIEAFGGEVSVISPLSNGPGARIEFVLPAQPALEAVD